MKQIIFLLFAIFFSLTVKAQEAGDQFLSGKLSPGYPAETALFVADLDQVKSAVLATGIDSLKVIFGTHRQNEVDAYWSVLIHNGKGRTYIGGVFDNSDSTELPGTDLDFRFNSSSMKVSVKVLYNPDSEEIFYQWQHNGSASNTASIQKVIRSIQKHEPMPDFKVRELDGSIVSLDDFKGKYVVINWWATTCGPCLLEMPGLNKMVEKYSSRTDVEFIAIAHNEQESLEKFLAKRDFNYRQTLSNSAVATTFGLAWPKHIVVDPQGIVTYYLEGGSAEIHQDIERHLDSRLKGLSGR